MAGVDLSAELADFSINDLVPEALDAARRRLRQGGRCFLRARRAPDVELLRGLGVVDRDDWLLRAGEVLFCHRRDQSAWVVYQHRSTPGGESTVVERLAGPLIKLFDQLVDLAWARRHVTPLNLPDGTQLEVADFAAGVTETNILTHPSKPRNRCLFQAARELRIAEETGRDVDRMFRELLRSGHSTRTISQRIDSTRVALVGGAPRTQVVRFVEQLDEPGRYDVDTLQLIFTVLSVRMITAADFAPIIQKSEAEAEAVLRRFADDRPGLVEPTRESARLSDPDIASARARSGRSAAACPNHRRTVDDIDRKVIAHVNKYGRISNRTIQNLLDIDVYRARDLLRDLRDRGILVQTSQHERGTAVEYGSRETSSQPRRSPRTADSTDEPTQTLFDPPPTDR